MQNYNRNFDTFFQTSSTFIDSVSPDLPSYYMDLRKSEMSGCGFGPYMRQYDCLVGKIIEFGCSAKRGTRKHCKIKRL